MVEQIWQVSRFMQATGQDVLTTPTIPSPGIQTLRWGLIIEEANELQAASGTNDIVEVADALADLLYVVFGACSAYGFSPDLMQEIFDEVHRSNMSKLCKTREEATDTINKLAHKAGDIDPESNFFIREVDGLFAVIRSSDGKALKSMNWSEPAIKTILERYGVAV